MAPQRGVYVAPKVASQGQLITGVLLHFAQKHVQPCAKHYKDDANVVSTQTKVKNNINNHLN